VESFFIEVWLDGKKAASYMGYPEDILVSTDTALIAWYCDLVQTRRWKLFCETFDITKCRSGAISHSSGTIRISNRKQNDNV
jgi:hypothetical protein